MKSILAGLQTHLEEETTSLSTCWKITRTDSVQFFFTDHDVDITFDGDIYEADNGYSRTAIQNDSSLAVDNLDIEGVFDSDTITEQDLRAGAFDFAEIRIFTINWTDTSQGILKMRRGWLGEVNISEQGVFRSELRGMSQLLSQTSGEIYQPECRADLGDVRCTVPIEPPIRISENTYSLGDFIKVATTAGSTELQYENRIYECTVAGLTAVSEPTYDTIVDNDTVDGTATFTARESWTRYAVIDTITDNEIFTLTVAFDETRAVDDWFNYGAFTFEDGDNSGKLIEIKDWVQSTREITLFLPAAYDIVTSTLVKLYPGCDRRNPTCQTKFIIPNSLNYSSGNIKNYRGEPFVPGRDEFTRYPDAP